jgi:hypothetical protein
MTKLDIKKEDLERADRQAQLIYAYMSGLRDGGGGLSAGVFSDAARQVFGFIRDLRERMK